MITLLPAVAMQGSLESVHAFWNTEACGSHFVSGADGDLEFYNRFRAYRYRTEWHLPELVPFAQARGQRVLEIGTGNEADGVMFALQGADYTAVNLTETALEATRRHFAVMGLTGAFLKENAERLSFADNSFDWVYSHGVLHHTQNTQAAVNEVFRVLKPGGRAIVMLYHKGSFNYVVRIMLWMRLRVLLKIFSRVGRWRKDRHSRLGQPTEGVRGNADRRVWEIHYRQFLGEGWGNWRADRFVHHCTDGPECPVANAFSKSEARRLFARFRAVELRAAHFPLNRYRLGDLLPFAVERWLAPRIGWYLFIFATK